MLRTTISYVFYFRLNGTVRLTVRSTDGFMRPDFIRKVGLAAKRLSTRGGEDARHVHINGPQHRPYPSNAIGKLS